MTVDLNFIHGLILKELAGNITEEDLTTLNTATQTNTEVWAMRKDMHELLKDPQTQADLKRVVREIEYDFLVRQVHKGEPKVVPISYLRRIVAVAAVILLAGAAYFIFKQQPKQAASLADQIAQIPAKGIVLTLADGQRLDLSAQQGNLTAGGVTLSNTNKVLSYSGGQATGATQWASLNVPGGKDYTIRLADGTEVQLNSASNMKFPLTFSGNTREITINGEAYLKVVKNTGMPFIVNLPNSRVEVLGTEFNVNSYDSGLVKISLVEGSVKMQAATESVMLKPGFQLEFISQKGIQSPHPFDADDVLSWREGMHVFHNASMEDVCRVIYRWYGIELKIENKTVAARRFTGYIDRSEPLITFLENLKDTKGIDYVLDDKNVLHVK